MAPVFSKGNVPNRQSRNPHRIAIGNNAKALKLLDHLYKQPMVSSKRVAAAIANSAPRAIKLLGDFDARGWLTEITGMERNRVYRYQPYMDLFHRETVQSAFETQATSLNEAN